MIPAATVLGQAFAGVVTALCGILAAFAAKAPTKVPMLLMVHRRLVGMALRLDRLTQRWQAGTLPRLRPRLRPRPRCAGQARAGEPPAARPRSPVPRERFWLIHIFQPTAQFAGQVSVFLADPQTQALVAAAPQAGRILRPLCHAFGLPPPAYLRLPLRRRAPPAAPQAACPAPPETGPTTPTSPAPTPPRPLPRWVRAAARAWRPRRP